MLTISKIINKASFVLFIITCFCSLSTASTTVHTYDSINRLTQTLITDGTKTTTITYQYDAAGNMTQSAVTVDSSNAATQGAKGAFANESNEVIDAEGSEIGNDVDLDDDNDSFQSSRVKLLFEI